MHSRIYAVLILLGVSKYPPSNIPHSNIYFKKPSRDAQLIVYTYMYNLIFEFLINKENTDNY